MKDLDEKRAEIVKLCHGNDGLVERKPWAFASEKCSRSVVLCFIQTMKGILYSV